jgi:large subunit ribosomal protein L31
MKSNIHPQWHHDTVVTCSCGNTFTAGSTLETIKVDICSACHPFFTGEMRFVDRQGRVDRFLAKMQLAEEKKATAAKKSKKAGDKNEAPQSYQEILRTQRSAIKEAAEVKTETPAN